MRISCYTQRAPPCGARPLRGVRNRHIRYAQPVRAAGRGGESTSALRSIAPFKVSPGISLGEKTPWYEKDSRVWTEATTEAELQAAISQGDGRMAVVEYFAGWCASCKSIHPHLTRMASDPTFAKNYKFIKCNIENPEIKELVRLHQIKGIPCVELYDGSGNALMHFNISFRRMQQLRANLSLVMHNPTCKFKVDPNGFAVVAP